jgi:hypothetical protein
MPGNQNQVTPYELMINNCKAYIAGADRTSPETLDAFRISEVLSIALCKDKAEILFDLVK